MLPSEILGLRKEGMNCGSRRKISFYAISFVSDLLP